MIKVSIVSGGQRNVIMDIRGSTDGSQDLPLTPMKTGDTRLKLDGLVWAIQEKMGVNLYWSEDDLILAMESRNSIRLDPSMKTPEDWDGTLYLSTYNQPRPYSTFYIRLDFDR